MTRLIDLINPPPQSGSIEDHKRFFDNQFTAVHSMRYLKQPSLLTNSNFSTLSGKGLNPTVQSEGNNVEFIAGWHVFGSTAANYTITPTAYAHGSTVQSSSAYFVKAVVSSFNGSPLYFYQRQPNTVRQYQQEYLIYGLTIKNNSADTVGIRMDVFCDYDGSTKLYSGKVIYVQPGQVTQTTSKILTDSLEGKTVGANNYTEFRFNFIDLTSGAANLDIYMIKCEPGEISTPL